MKTWEEELILYNIRQIRREDLEDYYKNDAERLRAKGLKKFSDKMLSFRTELKLIKEFYPTNISN